MPPCRLLQLAAFFLLLCRGLAFWMPTRSLSYSPSRLLRGIELEQTRPVQLFSESEGVDSTSEVESTSVGDEDWRAFRAKLVSGGIKTTEDEATPAPDAPVRKAVARKNTALLREQNPALVNILFGYIAVHSRPQSLRAAPLCFGSEHSLGCNPTKYHPRPLA